MYYYYKLLLNNFFFVVVVDDDDEEEMPSLLSTTTTPRPVPLDHLIASNRIATGVMLISLMPQVAYWYGFDKELALPCA